MASSDLLSGPGSGPSEPERRSTAKALEVLIVEDSLADAEISVLGLEAAGFKVRARRVETQSDYLRELSEPTDIVLSDHSMPAFDAKRALKLLHERDLDIPFIVVSGRIGESAAVDLMKAGANDYVRKDNLERLGPAVRRELAEADNRRRAQLTAEKLDRQERTLDTLMHNLPGMVYRLKRDGATWRFEFVSEGCLALTGHERETLVGGKGLEIWALLHGEPDGEPVEALMAALESDGEFTLEHQIRCANGDVKWVWHRGTAVAGDPEHIEGFIADVTPQKVGQAKLDYLAHHDMLTGLSNRMVFEEELGRSIERVKRHFRNGVLLFIDLDNFKEINDSWGHQWGDAVLRAVATRLTTCSRKGDILARLGGDEFALVMDDDEKAEEIAQSVQRILDEVAKPMKVQGREMTVTASIGVALFPENGEDVTALLRNADAAMYAAKEAGRNTFRFFAKKMNERARSMAVMRGALRQALKNEEFELQYQPVVKLADRRIVSVEALARWKRSQNVLMTAEHFISFAADTGMVRAIDRWVVGAVCRQAREWQDAGVPFGRIALNLSAQTFYEPRIVSVLEAAMSEYGVDPSWLEVEVTEAVLMQDMIATQVVLQKFADLGVALTLDDFGTGYSSLNNLRRFPLDRLKIARDFIKEIPWQEGDVQICRTILALASSLHIEAVAEGIENQEQALFLHHAGCESGQGYFFAMPQSAEDVAELLREGEVSLDPERADLVAQREKEARRVS
ncbi:MAG TPA: EAL domain-containing protein [Gammaproteobacteria bacterium]|nr:EAL domain-containing protein [Gammaproteobacteria bacterium]